MQSEEKKIEAEELSYTTMMSNVDIGVWESEELSRRWFTMSDLWVRYPSEHFAKPMTLADWLQTYQKKL